MIDSARPIAPQFEVQRRRWFDRVMHWDANLPSDLIERLWHDPHALLADGPKLQDKPRCTVVRLEHASGPLLFKHHNWGGPIRTLKKVLRRAPAKQCWLDGHFLADAGVPTPRPRAIVERRLGPLGICSYLLTDFVEGISLYRFMRFENPPGNVVQELALQVAAIWQQLDDLKVSHNDLKSENWLIDPTGRVWLIDLELMRRHRNVDEAREKYIKDVKRLFHPRNWRSDPDAAEVFRRRLVQTPGVIQTLASLKGAAHPLREPLPATNRPSQLVSVLIPCCNDAQWITGCLASVRDIADEILIADAGSTDNTLELVRQFGGCRIIQRQFENHAEFENYAHRQARHAWVLKVLPRERLSPDLAKEVQDRLATEPATDGFLVTRRYRFWGHLVRYGAFRFDASLRLYRKDAGHYEMRDGHAEWVVASGKIEHMSAKMLYEACINLDQCFDELRRHAAASSKLADRRKTPPSMLRVLLSIPWRFFESYVLRGGFLDGWLGLHASCLLAMSRYAHEAALWEAAHGGSHRGGATNRSPALTVFVPNGDADGAERRRSAA